MVVLQRIKTRVKILAKALGDLIIRHHYHYHTLACQSLDVHVPVTCPKEYEFSCSSSPAAPTTLHVTKSKRYYPCSFYYYKQNHHHHQFHRPRRVHHVLPSGPVMRSMKSPLGRQVHFDGPINKFQPLMNCNIDGDDHGDEYDMGNCVDRAAEEFIERFHKDLRLQKLDFP